MSSEIVNEFIREYHSNPWHFLKESDVHASLYSRLFVGLKDSRIEILAKQPGNKSKLNSKDRVPTSLVHTEYGDKFDIVILDPESEVDFETLNQKKNGRQKSEAFWEQQLLAVIEIKHCQLGYAWENFLYGPRNEDVAKISVFRKGKNGKLAGLFLFFVQFHMEKEMEGFHTRGQSVKIDKCEEIVIETSKTGQYMVTPNGLYRILEKVQS